MVTGLDVPLNRELGPCNGCAKGKHPTALFPKHVSRVESILKRLHMDLQGPFNRSILGYCYALGIIDCHTRKGWKFYLKAKDEASDEIEAFVVRIENQTGLTVKCFQCDLGTEFINTRLHQFCREKGIEIQTSAPYTHQQNGVAERFNRTTHEHALAMLEEAGMSKSFWPEAHEYSNTVRNASPTFALDKVTPEEAFSN